MNNLEGWAEDAQEYLTQFSWIDDDTAKKIVNLAKERIPSGRVKNVLVTLGNEIFDAIAKDQDFQNAYSAGNDDAMQNAVKKVLGSLHLGSRYQTALSPFFPNLKAPKVNISNNGCADIVEINFREAGIFILNENYSGFGCNDGSGGPIDSELDVNLSLKVDKEDIIEYVVYLEDGIGDLSPANDRTDKIADIIINKNHPLQEIIRVYKLREILKPVIKTERQYLDTVKAMYRIKPNNPYLTSQE